MSASSLLHYGRRYCFALKTRAYAAIEYWTGLVFYVIYGDGGIILAFGMADVLCISFLSGECDHAGCGVSGLDLAEGGSSIKLPFGLTIG